MILVSQNLSVNRQIEWRLGKIRLNLCLWNRWREERRLLYGFYSVIRLQNSRRWFRRACSHSCPSIQGLLTVTNASSAAVSIDCLFRKQRGDKTCANIHGSQWPGIWSRRSTCVSRKLSQWSGTRKLFFIRISYHYNCQFTNFLSTPTSESSK